MRKDGLKVPIGVIPNGSGNGTAYNLGIENVEEALDTIVAATVATYGGKRHSGSCSMCYEKELLCSCCCRLIVRNCCRRYSQAAVAFPSSMVKELLPSSLEIEVYMSIIKYI